MLGIWYKMNEFLQPEVADYLGDAGPKPSMCECGCVKIVKFSVRISTAAFPRDGVWFVVYATWRKSLTASSYMILM